MTVLPTNWERIATGILSLFFVACSDPCLKKDGRFGFRNECEAPLVAREAPGPTVLFINATPADLRSGDSSFIERFVSNVTDHGPSLRWVFFGSSGLMSFREAVSRLPQTLDEVRPKHAIFFFDLGTALNDYLYMISRKGTPGLRDLSYEWQKISAFSRKRPLRELNGKLIHFYVEQLLNADRIAKEKGIRMSFVSTGNGFQEFGRKEVQLFFSPLSPLVNPFLNLNYYNLEYITKLIGTSGVDLIADLALGEFLRDQRLEDLADLLSIRITPKVQAWAKPSR